MKMSHYFRPCIDLHQGEVRQIVGSTLADKNGPQINFSATQSVEWYAELYKADNLVDGHIILLGAGNEKIALRAITCWRDAFQIGGGMDFKSAAYWLEQGAKRIIFTSWVITKEKIHWDRLERLVKEFGKDRIVVDISCQKFKEDYFIMTEQWQNRSQHKLTKAIAQLREYVSEVLVHSTAVEGKKQGIDQGLIPILSSWAETPVVTYAGGIAKVSDIQYIVDKGKSLLYFTVGSALDIFGGALSYRLVVDNFYKQKA